ALIQAGRVLALDAPGEIGRRFPSPLFAVSGNGRYELLLALRRLPHARGVFPFGEVIHYSDSRAGVPEEVLAADVAEALRADGFPDATVVPIEPGIEDTF